MPPARTVALIGGIGCGKSVVAELLARRGAEVLDADQVARDVVEPGSPGLADLVAAFGEGILAPDGGLDRAALARVAFATPAATDTLNAALHPRIGAELARLVTEARERSAIVVVAIPLYRPEHRESLGIDLVVCVDCDEAVARDRLVAGRGMSDADARARQGAQAPRADRVAAADVVLANDGTREELERAVDSLWSRLVGDA